MPDDLANVDAADIEVTDPPVGWVPEVTDDDPSPGDVRDLDVEADE